MSVSIPLDDVLAARRLSLKTWDEWTRAGLVEPATRLEDGFALDEAQVIRLIFLAAVRKAIRGRRSPEALAFALARAGDRAVPVELVKRGLSARLATTFGLARRSLQRMTGIAPRFGTLKSAELLAAAERVADGVAGYVPFELRGSVADIARSLAFGALAVIYLGADVRAQSRRVRELLRLLAAQTDPTAPLPARAFVRGVSRIADRLADARDLITLDQRSNPLFRKIEGVPAAGFWVAFDTWPELSAAIARTWTRVAEAFALPQLSSGERETFDTLLLASLVLFCADETSRDQVEANRELLLAATRTFENAIDKIVSLAEIAGAIRRLLPERERVPA